MLHRKKTVKFLTAPVSKIDIKSVKSENQECEKISLQSREIFLYAVVFLNQADDLGNIGVRIHPVACTAHINLKMQMCACRLTGISFVSNHLTL